jgi:threonine dehydrogenase-like Zn-dependent dehydrogenase
MGARKAEVAAGDTVVVIGVGPVGLCAVWAARMMGAGRVIAVDLEADRRARAGALGAITVNPADGPTVEQVTAMTDGRGADRVIEAIGLDQTIADALMAVRIGGYVCIAGVSPNFALPICAPLVGPRNLTIRFGVCDVPLWWKSLIPLFEAGRVEIGDFFSHRLPLSQAEVGYDLFANKKDGCFKVVFDPRE